MYTIMLIEMQSTLGKSSIILHFLAAWLNPPETFGESQAPDPEQVMSTTHIPMADTGGAPPPETLNIQLMLGGRFLRHPVPPPYDWIP